MRRRQTRRRGERQGLASEVRRCRLDHQHRGREPGEGPRVAVAERGRMADSHLLHHQHRHRHYCPRHCQEHQRCHFPQQSCAAWPVAATETKEAEKAATRRVPAMRVAAGSLQTVATAPPHCRCRQCHRLRCQLPRSQSPKKGILSTGTGPSCAVPSGRTYSRPRPTVVSSTGVRRRARDTRYRAASKRPMHPHSSHLDHTRLAPSSVAPGTVNDTAATTALAQGRTSPASLQKKEKARSPRACTVLGPAAAWP